MFDKKKVGGVPAPLYWQNLRTKSLQKKPLKKSWLKSKRKKPIDKVSKNKKPELAIYKVLSHDYLCDHPICECGMCGGKPATEVHHRRGRGKYLNVVKYFMAVCRECHEWIHKHSKKSLLMGWLISRFADDDWEDYAEEEYTTEDAEFEVVEPKKLEINSPDDLKKVIFLRDGSVMDIEEWTNIPYEGTSKTEDADFEIVSPKLLEDAKPEHKGADEGQGGDSVQIQGGSEPA